MSVLITGIWTLGPTTIVNRQTTDHFLPVSQTWSFAAERFEATICWRRNSFDVGRKVDDASETANLCQILTTSNPGKTVAFVVDRKVDDASETANLCQILTASNPGKTVA